MRLAIAQHTSPAAVRAQSACDAFALIEGLAESEHDRRHWEAALAGVPLQ